MNDLFTLFDLKGLLLLNRIAIYVKEKTGRVDKISFSAAVTCIPGCPHGSDEAGLNRAKWSLHLSSNRAGVPNTP
jgi:hypothetical protein